MANRNKKEEVVTPQKEKKLNQIPCKVCGEFKKTGEPRLSKLIEKFGSKDTLLMEYVCRSCRKKQK